LILKKEHTIVDTRIDRHDDLKGGLLRNILSMTQLEYANSMMASNQGGYHSKYQSPKDFYCREFQDLSDEIFEKCKPTLEYLKQRDDGLPFGFDIEMWANVNYQDDFNAIHNHTRTRNGNIDREVLISGIYYLKVPENSGRIVFPSELKFMKPFFKRNMDEVYKPKEGQLLLFYPHRWHAVEPNLSDEQRISIAFNLVATHQQ